MTGQGALIAAYAISLAILAAYALSLWRQAKSASNRRQRKDRP